MDYQIALSPDLDLRAADFAAAWNDNTEARTIAAANLTPSVSKSYFDPGIMAVILSTAGGIGVGVITNAIYDVLKAALVKQGKAHKHTKITALNQPDGTQLIVVDVEEEA